MPELCCVCSDFWDSAVSSIISHSYISQLLTLAMPSGLCSSAEGSFAWLDQPIFPELQGPA